MESTLGRIEDYNKTLPIVELYRCVQSEGSRFGRPTIAVRTTGCTHRCYFGEGGWCDSWYTSIHPEKGTFTFNDIIKILISLSPKFGNSVPVVGTQTPQGAIVDQKMIDQHNKFRLKIDTIKQTLEYHIDYHYKPVWDGTEENLRDIESFRLILGIPKHKTFIMPAGDTREELIKMYPIVFDMCAEKGYNMTGRDHIIAFDTKRGV
jgi:7-carboxy-7-deazaguanine synthase